GAEERFLSVRGLLGREARVTELARHQVARGRVVVDDEDVAAAGDDALADDVDEVLGIDRLEEVLAGAEREAARALLLDGDDDDGDRGERRIALQLCED